MKTLPLTVLAYEGPCLRAYLAMMRRARLMPSRLLLLVLKCHPLSGKPVGRWLPGSLRMWYARKSQELALNYWPRRIKAVHPELVRAMATGLSPMIDNPGELIDETLGPFSFERYAAAVDCVAVDNLRDPAMRGPLVKAGPGTVLFTGGGILPSTVIDLPGLRFLHVHPGHLPDVRGADGLLWSMLVRGRPAMSCFYLANGIDTGDIVAVRDYPRLRFDLTGMTRPDDQTLYRAIFSYCDPILRADLLVNHILVKGDGSSLAGAPQDAGHGVTYHFMHAAMRAKVLADLYVGSERVIGYQR